MSKWPNVELKELSESDKGLYDNVELVSDFVDLSFYDYRTDEKTILLAFYDKDLLIGGIKLEFKINNSSCLISDFFILNKFQENGYGKRALNKVIDYIKSNDRFRVNKVILDVCTENYPAVNLYWIIGFRPVDYDYLIHHWTMELLIDDYR